MAIDQRRQGAEVLDGHAVHPRRLREDLLDHQGIHIHEAHLEEMEGEDRLFLVLEPVGSDFATLPIEDEPVGAVPVLDNIESRVDLPAERFGVQVLTEEGVSHVLDPSEGSSKLIPIHEEANHQIVHLFCLGKA